MVTAPSNRSVRIDLPDNRYILAVVSADTAEALAEKLPDLATRGQEVCVLDDQSTGARLRFRLIDVLCMSVVNAPSGTFHHSHPVHFV